MRNDKIHSNAKEFFVGKTVGISGAAAMLGQSIVEKLFRVCPDIGKVVLFVKSTKNFDRQKEIELFTSFPIFDELRREQPHFEEKVTCVACNLNCKELTQCQTTPTNLIREIQVFIHAGECRTIDDIRLLFQINVQGLRKLLRMLECSKRLKSFVHISAAFPGNNLDRELTKCGVDYKQLERSLRWMSDTLLIEGRSEILGQQQNAYMLTKALAEDVIAKEGRHRPVCIARLSRVIIDRHGEFYDRKSNLLANMMSILDKLSGAAVCRDTLAQRIVEVAALNAIEHDSRFSQARVPKFTAERERDTSHRESTMSRDGATQQSSISIYNLQKPPLNSGPTSASNKDTFLLLGMVILVMAAYTLGIRM